MERWMTSRSRLATCARIRNALAVSLALVAASAQAVTLETQLRARVDYYPSDHAQGWGSRLRLKTGVRHELETVRLKVELLADATDTPWGSGSTAELGDAHLTWINPLGTLRLGHQQIAWGRADAFRLLDTVNPVRYPDAVFDDAADARLPVWMANWEGQSGEWQWQLLAGKDRRLNASDPGYSQFQPTRTTQLKTGGSGDIAGFRLGTHLGSVDLALHGLSSPNPQALWRPLGPAGLEQLSVRRQLWGISGDWSADSVVWRGEVASTRSETLDSNLRVLNQRTEQALLGADWEQDSWFVSPQLYWQALSPAPYSSQGQNAAFSSLLLQRKLMQDRLKLRAFWLHGFDTHENWWSLTIHYESSDLVEWRMALDHFRAEPGSLMSSFEELDRVSLEAIVRF